MKVVKFKKSAQFNMGYWKYTHNLQHGIEYLLFDNFMDKMESFGEFFESRDVNGEIPLYSGESLNGRTLLVISLGGYGDGLCLVQALNTLKKKYPLSQIDVSVNMDMFILMKQFGFKGGWINIPTRYDYVKRYDYYQSSESLEKQPNMDSANIAYKYCELFCVEFDLSNSGYTPYGISKITELPHTNKKRIAIQVDSASGNNRIYPFKRIIRLSELLIEAGFEVFLFGFKDDIFKVNIPGIFNYINLLPSISDVVSLISQMDAVVAPDSVGGHIGGMLKKPTFVLYSVTNTEKFVNYPTVFHITSDMPCSPCFKLYECPMGNKRCIALEHESVIPERVFNKIMDVMSK